MVANRPDWCISRQRAWGVPIAVFVEKRTGELLRDPAVMARIRAAFESEGADAWYASPPSRFLGDAYDPDAYEQVRDIVDVWFESGCTHVFTLERSRPALAGRPVSGGLGPASRLVPVLSAGGRRHAAAGRRSARC